jgi:hypothetical protein
VPPGVSVDRFADLLMLSCGVAAATGVVVVAVHGGLVLPGVQSPPAGGVVLTVLTMLAPGVALTMAVMV